MESPWNWKHTNKLKLNGIVFYRFGLYCISWQIECGHNKSKKREPEYTIYQMELRLLTCTRACIPLLICSGIHQSCILFKSPYTRCEFHFPLNLLLLLFEPLSIAEIWHLPFFYVSVIVAELDSSVRTYDAVNWYIFQ